MAPALYLLRGNNSMSRRRLHRFVRSTIWLWLLLIVNAAAAQEGQGRTDPTEELFTYFYKDPRPERLGGFIEKYGSAFQNWGAYPPLAGFFAAVFRTNPNWVDRLIPAQMTPNTIVAVPGALTLSGNAARADPLRARFKDVGPDEKLKSELAGLPARLEDLRIATPSHLDIVWGAALASGDGRYVQMILEFFAQTANQSDAVAIDVARQMLAVMGGPQVPDLRQKYGDAGTVRIVYAAVALWALQSNSKRHPFVDQVVTKYITEQSGTPAAKALAAVRPRNGP
jgi:hypothetical protein